MSDNLIGVTNEDNREDNKEDNKEDKLIFQFALTTEHRQMLEMIARRKYRGVKLSHALRLLIEDGFEGVKGVK